MSGGTGVIAGPEVDMAELETLAVDLNLNLGPSFSLGLAIGGQDLGRSVPTSRQNWPRFEPGVSGMLPAGDHQEDASAMGAVRLLRRVAMPPGITLSEESLRSGHPDINPGTSSAAAFRLRLRSYYQMLRPSLINLSGVAESQAFTLPSDPHAMETTNTMPNRSLRDVTTSLELAPAGNQEPNQKESKDVVTHQVGGHFDCNICLEMATEPVVTCCGHLFCWPCLYQWLHVHARHKECPVCKGSLMDVVITPIYGRGTSKESDEPGRSIPPRPHAHRINSKRQWQEVTVQERVDGLGTGSRSDLQERRSEAERSPAAEAVLNRPRVGQRVQRSLPAAEAVLNRLRVAQRVQRQHLNERLRLRLRGGALSSPSTSTVGQGSSIGQSIIAPVQDGTQPGSRHQSEQMLPGMMLNRLDTADSLTAFGASTDAQQVNLAHVQSSLGGGSSASASDVSEISSISSSRGSVVLQFDTERLPSPRNNRGLSSNMNGESQQGSSDVPLTLSSWVGRHRAEGSSSGSSDIEPGLLHARKRRRLN